MAHTTVAKHLQLDHSVPISLTAGSGAQSSTEAALASSLRAAAALERVISALNWMRPWIEQPQQQQQQQAGDDAEADDNDDGRSGSSESGSSGGESVSPRARHQGARASVASNEGGGQAPAKASASPPAPRAQVGDFRGTSTCHRSPHRWMDLLQESHDGEREGHASPAAVGPRWLAASCVGSTSSAACAPSTPCVGVSLGLPSLSPFSLSPSPDIVPPGGGARAGGAVDWAANSRRQRSRQASAGHAEDHGSGGRQMPPGLLKGGHDIWAEQSLRMSALSHAGCRDSEAVDGDWDAALDEVGQAEEGAEVDVVAAAVSEADSEADGVEEVDGRDSNRALGGGDADDVDGVDGKKCDVQNEDEVQRAAEDRAPREEEVEQERERQRQLEREKEKRRLDRMEEARLLLEKERVEKEAARRREQEWARQRAQEQAGDREHEKEIEIDMELASVRHLLALLEEGYRPHDAASRDDEAIQRAGAGTGGEVEGGTPSTAAHGELDAGGCSRRGAASGAGGAQEGGQRGWWMVGEEEEWWQGGGSPMLVSCNKAQTVAKVGCLACPHACERQPAFLALVCSSARALHLHDIFYAFSCTRAAQEGSRASQQR